MMTSLANAPDFLTVPEVAVILRTHANTVYARIQDGTLPAVRFGRRLVVPRAAIERLMSEALEEVPSE
jgi:excisionase family DNA binding protein